VTPVNAAELFHQVFGYQCAGVWSAPGRVNLIGEHTDYNNGLVLPFAIDARVSVAATLTTDGLMQVVSAQQDGVVHSESVTGLAPGSAGATGWPAYVYGAVWVLREQGHQLPGLHLALDSTVPSGAGLSSSAAIECATMRAVSDLLGLALSVEQIARNAQLAENNFVGMPCGLMDQMASAACTAGHALFFDTGFQTAQQVPFDPTAEDLTMLVVDTKVKHALTDGEYANRRVACESAAAELGISSLRELGVDDLAAVSGRLSSELLRRRVRHVVTENARVAGVVNLLLAGKIANIGGHLTGSHQSLRDDYEVSDPALDLAVETALVNGALGARMTGGGFGGSAIALVPDAFVDDVTSAIHAAFRAEMRTPTVISSVLPGPGARRDR
jgi:galactokinase